MIALRPFTAIFISVLLSLLPAFHSPSGTDITSINSWFTSSDNVSGDVFGARQVVRS